MHANRRHLLSMGALPRVGLCLTSCAHAGFGKGPGASQGDFANLGQSQGFALRSVKSSGQPTRDGVEPCPGQLWLVASRRFGLRTSGLVPDLGLCAAFSKLQARRTNIHPWDGLAISLFAGGVSHIRRCCMAVIRPC
jgi:hypothetical protein